MKMLAMLLAAVCFIVAFVYWFGAGHHVKHGLVFAILGVLALVWLRFLSAAPART